MKNTSIVITHIRD